ncbi:MAG: hypothetical protein N2447_03145 [Thermoanaerobaculum sp.]|nr:hypothetical protein [Thermoanaerobaculum sp.]
MEQTARQGQTPMVVAFDTYWGDVYGVATVAGLVARRVFTVEGLDRGGF